VSTPGTAARTWHDIAAGAHGARLLIEHAGFDPDDPTRQRIVGTSARAGVRT
jgi:hypothetical protein